MLESLIFANSKLVDWWDGITLWQFGIVTHETAFSRTHGFIHLRTFMILYFSKPLPTITTPQEMWIVPIFEPQRLDMRKQFIDTFLPYHLLMPGPPLKASANVVRLELIHPRKV